MTIDVSRPGEWDIIALEDLPRDSERSFRVRLGRTANRVYAAEPFRPVLVLGPQRSYKTSGFAIPAILDWPGPALVTSVRRDILDDSFRWRSTLGNVWIFDPAGSLLGTEYQPFRRTWNPLRHCATWDDCVKTAHALTEAGKLNGLREGEFWENLSAQVLAPLLFAAKATDRPFSDVVRWVKDAVDQGNEVPSILNSSQNVSAIRSYNATRDMADVTRQGVYATLWASFRIFDYDQVTLDDAEELDIDEFLDSAANSLYICAPPDDQEEYRPQFTAVVRTVLREVYKRNHGSTDLWEGVAEPGPDWIVSEGRCPLLVLLDEAGNIAALENLGTLATTAAGTSVQLICIFHDISQIEGIYGAFEAQSIINNHSAFVVLPGCRDTTTLSHVEALLRGERVANTVEAQWNSPRQIRSMRRGTSLLIYENLRPIVLTMRSKFTDETIAERVRGNSEYSPSP